VNTFFMTIDLLAESNFGDLESLKVKERRWKGGKESMAWKEGATTEEAMERVT